MSTLLLLFYEFFKTGLFAVGGGLATLPFLYKMAARYDWFTADMLGDFIAIGESTPGPIGVNVATAAGFNAAGVPGALVATLALVLPSVIVISVIARFFERYSGSRLVENAFGGVRPAVTGLIAASGLTLVLSAIGFTGLAALFGETLGFSPLRLGLVAIFFLLMQIKPTKRLHPVLFILTGALLGVLLKL